MRMGYKNIKGQQEKKENLVQLQIEAIERERVGHKGKIDDYC
jgi:hypothetical protein